MRKVAKPCYPLDNGNGSLEAHIVYAGPDLTHHSAQCNLISVRNSVRGQNPPKASRLFTLEADPTSKGLPFTPQPLNSDETATPIPPGFLTTRRMGPPARFLQAILIRYSPSRGRLTWRSLVILNPHVTLLRNCEKISSPDLAMKRNSSALKCHKVPDH
jgi:hypothetical protein